MRRLIIATFVSMAWVVPVKAQDAPHDQAAAPHEQSAAPNDTQNHNDTLWDAMQRTIEMRLAAAGFTDIKMVPTSFLISATDRNGHSITLMASPSSIAQPDDPGQGRELDDDSDGDVTSDRIAATGRCVLENK